jgi:lipid-binding SYLF domain-containing protein
VESRAAVTANVSGAEDGFYTDDERPVDQAGPKKAPKVLKKIPQKVIENAVGLAIFTTMRTGLWISGAGGSGVLVARQEDGSWSPPSGIMLHTAGLGFLVGVDIYDCVLVINNRKALEAFTKIRATLGGEISAVAGPVGVGGVLENDGKWKQANRPVFTYLKSRGFYAGVQVDGTVVIERSDENARFYGEKIGVGDILAGKARHPPPEIRVLMETLRAAEGDVDVDGSLMDELDAQLAPGDLSVEAPGTTMFGVPEPDDPDPYGVHALEKEGLEVLEAGTRSRPSSFQFEYHPSPSSPTYSKFYRKSMENAGGYSPGSPGSGTNSPWRRGMNPSYASSDAGTQTDGAAAERLDGFEKQDVQHRDESNGPDNFYDVPDGEADVFVNGTNPWKGGEVDRDSGVVVDDSVKMHFEDDDEHQGEETSEPVKARREPPPLPPRKLT